MQIVHQRIKLGSLSYLRADERALLLWTMVVLNDLNILYSCVVMSGTDPSDKSPNGLARNQGQSPYSRTSWAVPLNTARAFDTPARES